MKVFFCVISLALVLVSSCRSVESGWGVAQAESSGPVEACLDVSFGIEAPRLRGAEGLSNECGAQSRSIDNPGVDTDEATSAGYTPRDIWMVQYGGTTDDALLLGRPRYIDVSGEGTSLQAVLSIVPNTLIFVANTHDLNLEWGDISTLGRFKATCHRIDREADCYGNNMYNENDLLLSGQYQGVISSGPIAVPLRRNIVRLDFTLKNGASSGMTLRSVQLCNVPRSIYYAAGLLAKNAVPSAASEFMDYPAQNLTTASIEGGSESFTFYMPANDRGVVMASTSGSVKPLHAPGYASHIRVEALDPEGKSYVYTVYPGANTTNDYNLSANNRYALELSVNSAGDASSDGRVEQFGRVDFAWANSYILNPGAQGAQGRFFTFSIDKVNDFWRSADPGLVIGADDEWVVELLWQDTHQVDLIRFVDPSSGEVPSTTFRGRGPAARWAVVTPSGSQGNALIGLRRADNPGVGCLWSWHLWVTDYDPQYSATPIPDQYIYSVRGGEVHRYQGSIWNKAYSDKYMMDRNLGARSAEFSPLGALYYEFGRKDPLPCTNGGNVLCDITGTALPADSPNNPSTMNKDAGLGVTIATSVLNPTYYYYINLMTGRGDWTSEGKSGQHPWNHPVEDITLKSIYDPCPDGWKLPERGAWADYIYQPDYPQSSTTMHYGRDPRLGWNYGGVRGARYWPRNQPVQGQIYTPSLGLRYVYDGSLAAYNGSGYLWAVEAASAFGGIDLFFTSTHMGVNVSGHARAYAPPVRCVQQ